MAAPTTGSKLPRPIAILLVALAFVALTSTFVFFNFPYGRLRDPLADRLGAASGAEIRIGQLGPHLGLFGPGLLAESVVASWPDRPRQSIDRAVVRPGWSLSWLSGTPAIHLDLEGDLGGATGTLRLGDAPAWDGVLRNLDVSLLPIESTFPGTDLTGRVNAEVDLASNSGTGPPVIGRLKFDAHEGSLRIFNLPIALPYDSLIGDMVLGSGDLYAQIESLMLEGPMLRARLEGNIGGKGGREALDLAASLEAPESAIRSVLRGYGVRTDADGAASIHIGGTLARPAVQAAQ